MLAQSVNEYSNEEIKNRKELEINIIGKLHTDGRLTNFDWLVNSFIVVVNETFFSHPLDKKF